MVYKLDGRLRGLIGCSWGFTGPLYCDGWSYPRHFDFMLKQTEFLYKLREIK